MTDVSLLGTARYGNVDENVDDGIGDDVDVSIDDDEVDVGIGRGSSSLACHRALAVDDGIVDVIMMSMLGLSLSMIANSNLAIFRSSVICSCVDGLGGVIMPMFSNGVIL